MQLGNSECDYTVSFNKSPKSNEDVIILEAENVIEVRSIETSHGTMACFEHGSVPLSYIRFNTPDAELDLFNEPYFMLNYTATVALYRILQITILKWQADPNFNPDADTAL